MQIVNSEIQTNSAPQTEVVTSPERAEYTKPKLEIHSNFKALVGGGVGSI